MGAGEEVGYKDSSSWCVEWNGTSVPLPYLNPSIPPMPEIRIWIHETVGHSVVVVSLGMMKFVEI